MLEDRLRDFGLELPGPTGKGRSLNSPSHNAISLKERLEVDTALNHMEKRAESAESQFKEAKAAAQEARAERDAMKKAVNIEKVKAEDFKSKLTESETMRKKALEYAKKLELQLQVNFFFLLFFKSFLFIF